MYSFKDRLIDWANQRGAWTHIMVAVGIALVITAIILAAAMPSKSTINANAADISEFQAAIDMISARLSTKISQAELDNWVQNINNALGTQAGDISSLGNRVGNAETRLSGVEGNVTAINDSWAKLTCSPPEAYLTGTFRDYTLHVKSSEAGNFTANMHLVYSPSVGNAINYTETLDGFYAGINWAEPSIPAYICSVNFNGSAWGISEVWFNIGTFEITDNETRIDITCAGLNSAWEPDFVYAEVFKIQ